MVGCLHLLHIMQVNTSNTSIPNKSKTWCDQALACAVLVTCRSRNLLCHCFLFVKWAEMDLKAHGGWSREIVSSHYVLWAVLWASLTKQDKNCYQFIRWPIFPHRTRRSILCPVNSLSVCLESYKLIFHSRKRKEKKVKHGWNKNIVSGLFSFNWAKVQQRQIYLLVGKWKEKKRNENEGEDMTRYGGEKVYYR